MPRGQLNFEFFFVRSNFKALSLLAQLKSSEKRWEIIYELSELRLLNVPYSCNSLGPLNNVC
jgi:hypothetical protein